MCREGYVNYRPYGYVTLTEKGLKAARGVVRRHDVIQIFLTEVLGVDESVAAKSACRAEHVFGAAVLSRLARFNDFAASCKDEEGLLERFRVFCGDDF